MEPMTEDLARERCAYWQKVLRLEDWDLDVRLVRRQVLPRGVGATDASLYRRAKIRLLDPLDHYDEAWPQDNDVELTLVHELLHLVFEEAGRPALKNEDSAEYQAFERAIEHTAVALLRLDRAAQAGTPA